MISTSKLFRCCAGLLAATVISQPAAPQGNGRMLSQLPPAMVPNQGQWASPELYRMQAGGMDLFFERTGWSFWLRQTAPADDAASGANAGHRGGDLLERPPTLGVAVRMSFVGAGSPTLAAERPHAGVRNYLAGEAQRTGVAGYGAVLYRGMYPGVDVRVREAGGLCEYDLLLAPAADLATVRVRVEGALALELDEHGSLVMQTAFGAVTQPAPTTWTMNGATRRSVDCRYVLHGDGTFGFCAPERDPGLALVVDPPLLWSSYVSGSAYDDPTIVKETGTGRILVAGYTESSDFPTTPGVVQTVNNGSGDGYIMLIDPALPPANQVVFATYLGGSDADSVSGVELTNGLIAFAGQTRSSDLPVTPAAYQSSFAGGIDTFVGTMDPTGSTLVSLSYFGALADDGGYVSLHADAAGNLHVAGYTTSTALPTTANAYQTTKLGSGDGFIAVFDPTASTLTYSTYFGGNANEGLWAGDLDSNGVLTLASGTSSSNLPVTANAVQTTRSGANDVMVLRFDPAAAMPVVYCSYLGGIRDEGLWGIKRTPGGRLLVSGTTESSNFPTTTKAYQSTFQGGIATNFLGGDAFVALIDPTMGGSAGLVASTYFGGNSFEQGYEADMDTGGEITLSGWVNVNSSLPTTPGAMRRTPALNDGFIARFSADLSQLLYASYVGGTDHDGAWLLDRHADGVVTVFGQTLSNDVPMLNGFQSTNPGAEGPWIARYDLVPDDTMRRGSPTPGSAGSPTIHAIDDAVLGNAQFGFACTRAPTSAAGLLVMSLLPAPGTPLFGIDLFVDPTAAVSTFVQSDGSGESTWSLPLPNFAFGSLHAQYLWLESGAPLVLSASDAIQVF